MSEKYYYSLASGPSEIATTISTTSQDDFETTTCLVYVLPEKHLWSVGTEQGKEENKTSLPILLKF